MVLLAAACIYNRLMRIIRFINHHATALLWSAIVAFILAITAACLWKYSIYAYDAMDLAMFNSIFWKSLHGQLFGQSIHPHLSLGDHAELVIPVLLPLYALRPDPRTLLVLQAAALALPAAVIYNLTKRRLTAVASLGRNLVKPLALLVAALWLIYPATQNAALFEFHILPFAILPLFLAASAYDAKRAGQFAIWSALALLVREDVALVVAGFGLLAWLEDRPWKWRLYPIIAAGLWFVVVQRIIGFFAPAGSYKFLVYYGWLGSTWPELAANLVRHPWRVAAHLMTLGNLEMVLAFLMPLLFLPLVRPKRLTLAVGPLLAIVLSSAGGGALISQTHYATLFIVPIFLATIEAAAALAAKPIVRMPILANLPTAWFLGMVVAGALYSMVFLGPLPSIIIGMWGGRGRPLAELADAAIAQIPTNAPVAAGYRFLPRLSSRNRLYSLNYLFFGSTQFGERPYLPPDDLAYILTDDNDFLTYLGNSQKTTWMRERHDAGRDRLAPLAGETIWRQGPFALYGRDGNETSPTIAQRLPITQWPQDIAAEIVTLGPTKLLTVTYGWGFADHQSLILTANELALEVALADDAGRLVWSAVSTLDGGIASDGQTQAEIIRTASFPLPPQLNGVYRPTVRVIRADFDHNLTGLRSSENLITKKETVWETALEPIEVTLGR